MAQVPDAVPDSVPDSVPVMVLQSADVRCGRYHLACLGAALQRQALVELLERRRSADRVIQCIHAAGAH